MPAVAKGPLDNGNTGLVVAGSSTPMVLLGAAVAVPGALGLVIWKGGKGAIRIR